MEESFVSLCQAANEAMRQTEGLDSGTDTPAPILLCQYGEVVDDDRVELSGEVALEAADDFSV